MRRVARTVAVMGVALVGLAACSPGVSQQDLDAARSAGASEASASAAQQEQVDKLKRQIDELQRDKQAAREAERRAKAAERRASADNNNGGGGSSGLSGPVTACGDGVYAGSATSCSFAMNVAGEYGSNPGATTITAFSPVTGTQYTLSCSPWSGGGHVCTGGNNASIYLP